MTNISKVEIEQPFYIEGHKQMITSMVSGVIKIKDNVQSILATGGRDKKITIWNISNSAQEAKDLVVPKFTLTGHNHFVSDLTLNSSNEILLSGSWDGSMRLWNLANGQCKQTFFGVNKEITACGISFDNRVVYSSGMDNITTIWNTQGQIKATTTENQHTDVITRMRVAPIPDQPYYLTVSWDGLAKVWNKFCVCQASFNAHEGPIYALDINKNGQYFVTGGKDGKVKVWKYSDLRNPVKVYEFNEEINEVKFSSQEQWIAVATNSHVRIIDLQAEDKNFEVIAESSNYVEKEVGVDAKETKITSTRLFKTVSLCWDEKSDFIFGGCDNGLLKVMKVTKRSL